jgi:hypothetical protein
MAKAEEVKTEEQAANANAGANNATSAASSAFVANPNVNPPSGPAATRVNPGVWQQRLDSDAHRDMIRIARTEADNADPKNTNRNLFSVIKTQSALLDEYEAKLKAANLL